MLVRAEIEHLGEWREITIADAQAVDRRRIIRCPRCHQRLSVHKARADGKSRAHFEHWPNSDECIEVEEAQPEAKPEARAETKP